MMSPILSFILTLFITFIPRVALKECVPRNWRYAWSREGNAWFTRARGHGDFDSMMEACKEIEPGRTTLASILTMREQRNVVLDLPDGGWWLGGVRIGWKRWHWMSDRTSFGIRMVGLNVSGFINWGAGQPTGNLGETCLGIRTIAYNRKWGNYNCNFKFRAICQLRC